MKKAPKAYTIEGDCVEVKLEINCVNKLVGQILTVLDTTGDKTQREALKTLAKREIWDWASEYQMAALPEQLKDLEDNSFSIPSGIVDDPRAI